MAPAIQTAEFGSQSFVDDGCWPTCLVIWLRMETAVLSVLD